MNWLSLRRDFYVAQDYFSGEEARGHLLAILAMGDDQQRGFHHPPLKPNRFHARPQYPVDRYMGLGLYWNPLDYAYHSQQPFNQVTPFDIPNWLQALGKKVVQECFPTQKHWQADAALVNYYTAGRKMGFHVDKEEQDHWAPVVGVNFGGTCRFYFENEQGAEESFLLPGNSVYVFGHSARLMRHAVGASYKKSLSFESSGLLLAGERLNITLRKVWDEKKSL